MVDPISVSSASRIAETSRATEAKKTITNEDFETTRAKGVELESHVEKLKESGHVNDDHLQMASREAQEIFDRVVQPGHEVQGYQSIFYDNRAKIENLRTEINRVGSTEETGKIGNYLDGIDKELGSLEGILNSIDPNTPVSSMEMLKLQTKMHHISEHVTIISKVVDQISSGIKTILQTNV
ncbi:MAG: hypothetical protein HY819_18110 [Acidobacteria bacterium]|nr:hypothetical protein [Acidobacteriota bacterium]